jgi:hypothetical protein
MRPLCGVLVAVCCLPAAAQESAADPVAVTTAHPRLLLGPQRLRLLRRERERNSMRWEQFAALISGRAPLAERGFALALYYQVSGDAQAGREAVAFALGPDADLRQQALVYDWCQEALGASQRRALAARLEKAIAAPPADAGVAAARSRALAAIALFDDVADVPQRELDRVVHRWWQGSIVPGLASGRTAIARDDAYPLFEFLHAMRDSTILDLRDQAPRYFRNFPLEHMVSYYPAPYQAADGLYYLGVARRHGEPGSEPDLRKAALSRAAELAMVAYDVNSSDSQTLQGWLMQDRFILRSSFGAPYEFLWADPYLPGLSYDHAPLIYHDADSGKLFVRSSWDDSATWFGWFDGAAQLYEDGLRPAGTAPLHIGLAAVCFGNTPVKCAVKVEEHGAVFIVGLAPRRLYQVEVENQKPAEKQSDPGGIMEIAIPQNKPVTIRVKAK